MANITITNVDTGSVVLEAWATVDGILENTGVAEDTFVAGTLLGRSTADGHLYPYDSEGENGLDAPKYVLTYDVTLAATSETPVTVLSAGKVNSNRLVVHGGSVTAADLDALLNRPIIPIAVNQLGQIDNPQS